MGKFQQPDFFIKFDELNDRIDALQPLVYIQNRNYLTGNVSYLSPFITHGVTSVKTVAQSILINHSIVEVEKMIFQLAWREYFHRVWQEKGNAIFRSLASSQINVASEDLSHHVLAGTTQVSVIDDAITQLYCNGYMHNHARMWYASLVCNITKTHWQSGAKWMHFHLLDGDLASNTLSWQWVAGTFSNKRYIANQDNIDKYSGTSQPNTFLDVSYEDLALLEIPTQFKRRENIELNNDFPESTLLKKPDKGDQVVLYHIHNLDPLWRNSSKCSKDETVMRILLIEPELYKDYPMSQKRWSFILHWAEQIGNLHIFVGSMNELFPQGFDGIDIVSREYPLTKHWPGTKDPREWLFPNTVGEFGSFFKYWKQAKKELHHLNLEKAILI